MAMLLAAVLVVIGCNRGEGDARDLAVSSDVQARAVVGDALVEIERGQLDAVLARFCDQTPEGRGRALDLLNPARGRTGLNIVRSEPAWVGTEPFFYVEVGDPARTWTHGFGVRARDGCLDRAVGATVLPDPKKKEER